MDGASYSWTCTEGPPISIFCWQPRASRTLRMRIVWAPSFRYWRGICMLYELVGMLGMRNVSGMVAEWCLISIST